MGLKIKQVLELLVWTTSYQKQTNKQKAQDYSTADRIKRLSAGWNMPTTWVYQEGQAQKKEVTQ